MNNAENLYNELRAAPVLDAHTHINASAVTARGLADILLYHMVVSDLYAAGCPDGARIDGLSDSEKEKRIEAAIPWLPYIKNTSCWWGVRIILHDLYGWDEEIAHDNWRKLDAIIRERSRDDSWAREIARYAGIRRIVTELWRGGGDAANLFQYSLEWAFFTRSQWGQYDTAILELEHSWSQSTPGPPLPVKLDRNNSPFIGTVKNLDDVKKAIKHYTESIPYEKILSIASHFSTDISYRCVSDNEMELALSNRANAGPHEREVYANYINEAFLQSIAKTHPDTVLQFSLGAEPLPYETGSKMKTETVFELAQLFNRHRDLQFNLFISCEHQNQAFCTLVRELPNVSLSGYWWHNFFPGSIRKVMETRLDMMPLNRFVGFFSDAYCLDWAYAKSLIVRRQMAEVLNDKIELGQYTKQMALDIASELVYNTPQSLLGMVPLENHV